MVAGGEVLAPYIVTPPVLDTIIKKKVINVSLEQTILLVKKHFFKTPFFSMK